MKWITGLLVVSIVSASRLPDPGVNSNTRLLKNIFNSWNKNVSECTNFFEYACGNYAIHHLRDPFPNTYEMLDHKMNKQLVQLMEKRRRTADFRKSSVDAKALRFYHNCREAPPETRKIEHYLRLAPPGEGLTWPPITPSGTSWPKDQFKWMDTLAHLNQYGFNNVLINIGHRNNWQNSSEVLLRLDKPGSEINLKGVRKILRSLRLPSDRIQNLIRLLERLDWDVSILAKKNGRVQIMTVQRLNSATGYNWEKFIEIIVGHSIEPNFRVEIENLPYLTAITKLIDSYDNELVAYYIMSGFVKYLQEDTEFGSDPLDCIVDVRRNMYVAANLLFQENFLPTLPLYTQEVEEVFEQIRHQLILKIERNRLELNEEQKEMISEKVGNTVLNIGNMPKGRDHRSFAEQHYGDLEIPSKDLDFAREHLKLLRFRTRKEMAPLLQPDQNPKDFFFMTDRTTSGPYYLNIHNVIIIPYGLLQEPYFDPDSHDVFKFSLMGRVLGHELMHAVDRNKIWIDRHGHNTEIGWEIWKLPRFQEGFDCIDNGQPEKFAERMADIVGLDLAYSAYFNGSEVRNPTDFTDILSSEQIFFLNYAQAYCSDGYPAEDDKHDAAKLRLKLSLIGTAPFARAFGCTQPKTQCQWW